MSATTKNLSVNLKLGQRWIQAIAAASLSVTCAATAMAQDYPSKQVVVVVPFAPGGTVDNVARHVQEALSSSLKQTVIVENRAGAGGTIGTGTVAKAQPDGYRVGMVFDSYATEAHIYPALPYSPEKDLTGVSYMVRSPMVLVVPASSPYKTLQDYITAAKTPDTVSYASVGAGSSNHLAAELFHETAGTSALHTPYKGGGPAMTDLMGAHVDSMIASLPLVLPHVQAGKLRALGVTSQTRATQLPDVPAISETFNNFEVYSWVGMIAPAKTPEAVVKRLSDDVNTALKTPAVSTRLNDAGFEIVAGSPEQMNALTSSESQRWGRLIADKKIGQQ
jgi:tripartite-type tricarboxylate transporter receptor subunit TctC